MMVEAADTGLKRPAHREIPGVGAIFPSRKSGPARPVASERKLLHPTLPVIRVPKSDLARLRPVATDTELNLKLSASPEIGGVLDSDFAFGIVAPVPSFKPGLARLRTVATHTELNLKLPAPPEIGGDLDSGFALGIVAHAPSPKAHLTTPANLIGLLT